MNDKTTLIIPCAGKSTRFPSTEPKWMLKNDYGTTMLSMAMEPYKNKVDKIIVTVTKQQFVKHRVLKFLLDNIPDVLSLCVLNKETKSAAETVYETIKDHRVQGNIIIKDSDCYTDYDINTKLNEYIVGLDVRSNNVSKLAAKSFIHKDDHNIITDIIEKKIVSSNICVGTYACKSKDFCKNYLELKYSPIFYSSEIYVSYVFSHMILTSTSIFSYIESSNFIDFGSIDEWSSNKNKLA